MRTILVSLRLVIAVGGCETPPTPVSGKEQMTVLDAGDAAVTALGTPSSPLKSVSCAMSAAVAMLIAAFKQG